MRRISPLAAVFLPTAILVVGGGGNQGQLLAPPSSPIIESAAPEGDPLQPFPSEGDLWLNTWADDDALYSGWGDGRGVAAHPDWTDCGVARFTGEPPDLVAEERCFAAPTAAPPVNDKPSSLLFLDGRLVGAFHSPLGNAWIGYLAVSLDHGATWTRLGFYDEGKIVPVGASPWTRDVRSPFRCLFFVNMGRDFALSTDGYVYALGIGTEWAWPGGVYLARVARADVLSYGAYRYFAGLENGVPRWSAEQTDSVAVPGLATLDQGSAMFHPGINRYLFLTSTRLYDAPEPWGPWTLAAVWTGPGAPLVWQGGYQPGIVAKGWGPSSFYFTIAGQNKAPLVTYSCHLGKMVMKLRTDETVSTPQPPAGATTGWVGEGWSFTAAGAVSSLGHAVEVQFDWRGDGTDLSPWGAASRVRAWPAAGEYSVRAHARCAGDPEVLSAWSAGSPVHVLAARLRRHLPRSGS